MIPIAVQNLLVTVENASDAFMLGYISDTYLSAANLAGQVTQVYNTFLIAMCVGTTVLAAQYWGAKDIASIEEVLNITLRISINVGFLLFLVCMICPDHIMRFFTNETTLIGPGCTYLRYVATSYLFMGFSQVYMAIMKNSGKVKKSALIGSIAAGLNVALNFLLIFGLFGLPRLGIGGAALATTISHGVEFLLTVISSRQKNAVQFHLHDFFRSHARLRKKYIKYTMPNLIQSMSWRLATTVTIAIIGHLGRNIVAANSVAVIVFDAVCAICMALASGSGIIIGQMLGKAELDQARETGDQLLMIALFIGIGIATVMIVSIPGVQYLASSLSEQAIYYLKWILIILAIKMIGKAINNTLSNGIFVAGGDMHFLMKLDIINMWCVIVPIGLLAAFVFHLPALIVFALTNMDEYTKMYVEMKHYKKYKWVKNLTEEK